MVSIEQGHFIGRYLGILSEPAQVSRLSFRFNDRFRLWQQLGSATPFGVGLIFQALRCFEWVKTALSLGNSSKTKGPSLL